ncbi:biotin--[acetyl-CoA-carboxylase] ligase [Mangrovihabitans endophyticus]|nr:biotin--[acetyl-CoA-carboxylase] ligase [Mangrovihabitans endophyticus]
MPVSPYRDLDRPPLSARALERALIVPGGLWRRLDLRAETESTNADATGAARDGEPEGLVVVAEWQDSGRGRLGRRWVSPPGAGLTLSVLLRPGDQAPQRSWPAVPRTRWGWLPLLTGVAVGEAVDRVAGLHATLKWPNDVLVRQPQPGGAMGRGAEGKCAGVLAEVAADAVVVGVGLNVTTRADELPPTDGLPATSLRLAGSSSADRDPLLRALLRGLAGWYGRWRAASGDAEECGLLAAYRGACATIDRMVSVQVPGGGAVTGRARTVDADGQLVIRREDGTEARVSAGDVLHVR